MTIHDYTKVALLSTNSDVEITRLDAMSSGVVSFTITVPASPANAITWTVEGANQIDFSDSQILQAAASVAAGAKGTFTSATMAYRYARVLIKATVGGSQNTPVIAGVAKNQS